MCLERPPKEGPRVMGEEAQRGAELRKEEGEVKWTRA